MQKLTVKGNSPAALAHNKKVMGFILRHAAAVKRELERQTFAGKLYIKRQTDGARKEWENAKASLKEKEKSFMAEYNLLALRRDGIEKGNKKQERKIRI